MRAELVPETEAALEKVASLLEGYIPQLGEPAARWFWFAANAGTPRSA
jgi:hypothetical protein